MLGSPGAIQPWNYFWRIATYVITVPKRHRQTDGRMGRQTCSLITTLCISFRGKNFVIWHALMPEDYLSKLFLFFAISSCFIDIFHCSSWWLEELLQYVMAALWMALNILQHQTASALLKYSFSLSRICGRVVSPVDLIIFVTLLSFFCFEGIWKPTLASFQVQQIADTCVRCVD